LCNNCAAIFLPAWASYKLQFGTEFATINAIVAGVSRFRMNRDPSPQRRLQESRNKTAFEGGSGNQIAGCGVLAKPSARVLE
jgi:hypothetical protein